MKAFTASKRDGTEGTATCEMKYCNEGKMTQTFYGCIVKNDANLQKFIKGQEKPSANMEKFRDTKYFFYTCDPGFKEQIYTETKVTCHRFSNPGKPYSRVLSSPSPGNIVKVDQHIFLLCDFQEFNDSKFLNKYSKEIILGQDLNLNSSAEIDIYGLSYDVKDGVRFIPLKLSHHSSNVYGVDANYEKLESAGPVLLPDKKTVIGRFEKKGENGIYISIFGNNQGESPNGTEKHSGENVADEGPSESGYDNQTEECPGEIVADENAASRSGADTGEGAANNQQSTSNQQSHASKDGSPQKITNNYYLNISAMVAVGPSAKVIKNSNHPNAEGAENAENNEANAKIETAFASKEEYVSFEEKGKEFTIDLVNMIENSTADGVQIETKIKRRDLTLGRVNVPDHWDTQPKNKAGVEVPVHLVDLHPNCPEYLLVQSRFKQTCSGNHITKIKRVQNPEQYKIYSIRKQKMDEQTGSNEKQLFHGTAANSCESINLHGFNRSYCGKNSTLFGKGVYFAANAGHSATKMFSPADIDGNRYMYLARVLTGVYTKGNSYMIVPPPKNPAQPNDIYDTVVNDTSNPSIFVVFKDGQAYPEYLIEFR